MLDVSEDAIVVADTTRSPKFRDHPLVVGAPQIRFYAATRLTVNVHVLGTLCAYDMRPKHIASKQVAELQLLGKAVVELLARRSPDPRHLARRSSGAA